jgi:hypothetical protein
VNAEFNWWLLIVGLVVGAALVYLVLADASRRESEVSAEEVPREAAWIASILGDEGDPIPPETAERVLELHRAYLASPPPDAPVEVTDPEPVDAAERPAVADGEVPVERSRPR